MPRIASLLTIAALLAALTMLPGKGTSAGGPLSAAPIAAINIGGLFGDENENEADEDENEPDEGAPASAGSAHSKSGSGNSVPLQLLVAAGGSVLILRQLRRARMARRVRGSSRFR